MQTDSSIQKNVMEELKWEPFLKASEIGVAVKNGIVTLSGTVDMYSKKKSAEKAAYRVAGVKAVAEDIDVRVSPGGERNDTQIAEAVLNAFKWDSSVPDDKIKIKVENGWVTLEGQVEWQFQRRAVRTVVENLRGVVGITNNIEIKPLISTVDVKHKIADAFHRSATIDSGKINVTVHGGKVVLSGNVRSYSEKKDAESAAWHAPGVSSVENKIDVLIPSPAL